MITQMNTNISPDTTGRWRYLKGTWHGAKRSSDLQSAVPPACRRQSGDQSGRVQPDRRPAGFNTAIRRIENLRSVGGAPSLKARNFEICRLVVCCLSMLLWIPLHREAQAGVQVTGELKKWHDVVLTFDGPETSESAQPNPFRDFRLIVTFTHAAKQKTHLVSGYFAADGQAAETSASSGNKWRVHFVPDETGDWNYSASFRSGPDVALSLDPQAGQATSLDNTRGTFAVRASDKKKPDFRARGLLRYAGQHYLKFAETGEYFIKGGADSPENFLAYVEFDQTPTNAVAQGEVKGEARRAPKHRYEPHARDWRAGDPTWQGGKGKNIIGALNYLSGKGMNSVYFLTMNVGGDGDDVWPWTAKSERERFDCSKLDQWEIVFSQMDKLGLMLHVVTQETENDQLLDGGDLGLHRKLYYRELVARFGHHLAITWNLGEENTNTDRQRQDFSRYLHDLDPYDHPVVVHTFPGKYDEVYCPLLGFGFLEGPSLQMGKMAETHAETIKWIDQSAQSGRKWMVCLDEIGPAEIGVKPDADDPRHDTVRQQALWGNLMAGGAGCEWYFGYKFAHNDLNMEDWRSRDLLWNQTRYALEFFHEHLPFAEMRHHDELTSNKTDYCLAKPGQVYAIYLPEGGTTVLQIEAGEYAVRWFNPRQGGALLTGTVDAVQGPGKPSIGLPPRERELDWVALVRKAK